MLKADGLAAGKGVVICADEGEAREAVEMFFTERRFGETEVVLEEYLAGEELSLLALCDGENVVPLAPAQDYKRIGDGDEGPNTGGMGSYSPVPGFDDDRAEEIADQVHRPIVEAMRKPRHALPRRPLRRADDRRPTAPGCSSSTAASATPRRRRCCRGCAPTASSSSRSRETGGLAGTEAEFGDDWAVTVVLASAGYPASSSKGDVIRGLGEAAAVEGVEITHAGTARARRRDRHRRRARPQRHRARAERRDARERAYEAAELIEFDGKQMRSDIAARAVERTAAERPERIGSDGTERAGTAAAPRPDPGPETMPQVEEAFEEIEVDAPLVGIIMGSKNDKPKLQPAGEALQDAGSATRSG